MPVIAGTGSNSTAEADRASPATPRRPAPTRVLVVDPLLQQADAGGPLPPFQGDQRRGRPPDHHLQHSRPQRSSTCRSTPWRGCPSCTNIAGVKDATADMARVSQQRAACGTEFVQLSGEDATALGFMAHGGHGCISVTANVAPRSAREFQTRLPRGRFQARARAAGQADAAARRAVRGDQSRPGEICRRSGSGMCSAEYAAAAGAARRKPPEGQVDAALAKRRPRCQAS